MLAATGRAAISPATNVGTLTLSCGDRCCGCRPRSLIVGNAAGGTGELMMAIGVSAPPVVALMSFCLARGGAPGGGGADTVRRATSSNSSRSRSRASSARSSPPLP